VAGTCVWVLLSLLANGIPLRTVALVAIVLYAAFYGVIEVIGLTRPRAPGSGWQIPSDWVRGMSRRRRIWIWGTMLGPGFATRNPYAGFGLLVLVVAAAVSLRDAVIVGASIGIAHATGRAFALLRDIRLVESADHLQAVLKSIYWRVFDGYALLVIGGVAVVSCFHSL
jgi:hypothetical protein